MRSELERADGHAWWRWPVRVTVVAVAYALAGRASFAVAVSHTIVTLVVFGAEGISLAAAVVFGPRIWPGVFLGQLVLALSNGLAWPLSLGISVVNSVEAVAGGWLFHRLGLRESLHRVGDAARLLALIALLQLFSATLGNAVLLAGGVVPPSELARAWCSWWFGNALGQVLVTPMILSLHDLGAPLRQLREAAIGVAALAPVSAVLLWVLPTGGVALVFAVSMPLLVVLAIQRGMPAVTVATCTMAALTLVRTHDLGGPFVHDGRVLMVDLDVFLLGSALVAQLIAAAYRERVAAEERHLELLRRLQRIAGEVPGVIFKLEQDVAGRFSLRYVNDTLVDLYGVAADEAQTDISPLMRKHHPEDRPRIAASVEASAASLTPWTLEYRIVLDSGAVRWLSGNATPHRAPEGSVAWYGFVTDVTDRKEIERVKDNFVATVSHELRTPLTSIIGALGLCAQNKLGAAPAPMARMLDVAHRNSLRLARLIDDLLDVETLAAGKMRFRLERQPLMPIVEQALEANAAMAERYGSRLELRRRADDAYVDVDAERLLQVLANLLSNAARYSPTGGVVSIDVTCTEGDVQVDVVDDGPGIPPSFRPRVFQKFSQADEGDNRKPGGTGLGLAISKELVERMGGRIGFDASEGGPTRFFFALPRVVAQAPAGLR